MFSRRQRLLAWILFAACGLVGLAGYAIPRKTVEPRKVWFEAAGGNVLFDHAYHETVAECYDCHHGYEQDTPLNRQSMACRACHYGIDRPDKQESPDSTHPRYIGSNCVTCHREVGMEVTCDTCHLRPGFAFEESGRKREPVPKTVTFRTDNGNVVFDHKVHISRDVGEPCIACHHECKRGLDMMGMPCTKDCRACHYGKEDQIKPSADEYHPRHIGANCAHCHDTEECGLCHTDS